VNALPIWWMMGIFLGDGSLLMSAANWARQKRDVIVEAIEYSRQAGVCTVEP
jgi:uncharacterized membrane protein